MKNISNKELIEELLNRFSDVEQLEKENNLFQEQISELNEKLKEAEIMKSHFLSNMMNEIVNPFSSILGLSKNISEVKNQDWKKAISMSDMIFREAFELDFQLKNIFAAAKIEAGEAYTQLSSFNVKSIIDGVADEFKIFATKKDIEIKVNYSDVLLDKESGEFIGDLSKLKLIISNLLDNAIKFSAYERDINIDAFLKNGDLVVKVKNYGKGIDDKDLKMIFDRFKQNETTIHSLNTGHGLGLSIVKAYCDMLNGNIFVETVKNEFAEFVVSIPEADKSDGNYFSEDMELFDDDENGDELF